MAAANKVAIILGAGASKPFGYPLTSEILPKILEGLENKKILLEDNKAPIQEEIDLLFRFFHAILPGLNGAPNEGLDLPLITEILSLIDQAVVYSYALHPDFGPEELLRIRKLLERAILEVLGSQVDARETLDLLAGAIIQLSELGQCALISTNYDTATEMAVYRQIGNRQSAVIGNRPVRDALAETTNFGINWRDPWNGRVWNPPGDASLAVLKLHGSMNWLKCELCNHIYINIATNIFWNQFRGGKIPANTCHCGHYPLRAVMVAPSMVRDIRDTNLLSVWKTALEAMRSADVWYIIGYSMPPEDIAIRSLLIRAYHAREVAPRVEVVQHGEATYSNYQLLFNLPKTQFHTGGLIKFIEERTSNGILQL